MEIIDGEYHYIPIAAAAAELHTTGLRILMLIKQNVMRGRQIDGEWYVEKSSLACFRSYDAEGADHKKCLSSCQGCSGR